MADEAETKEEKLDEVKAGETRVHLIEHTEGSVSYTRGHLGKLEHDINVWLKKNADMTIGTISAYAYIQDGCLVRGALISYRKPR